MDMKTTKEVFEEIKKNGYISNQHVAILRKAFPFLTVDELRYLIRTNSYKTVRGFINNLQKRNDEYASRANMPKVKRIEIEMTWRPCTYGNCPRGSMRWLDDEGWHYEENAAFAGGCGYDKTSTILADCLNKVCSGMLYAKRRAKKVPYGVSLKNVFFPYFCGGVGAGCYRDIAKFLGGEMEHVAETKNYDKFVFTF